MLLGHSLVGHEDHVITCVATPHPSFLYLWCPPTSCVLRCRGSHGRDGLVKVWSVAGGDARQQLEFNTQSMTFCPIHVHGSTVVAPSRESADVRVTLQHVEIQSVVPYT